MLFQNLIQSTLIFKEAYNFYKLGQKIIQKKSPINELDGAKFSSALYGLVVAGIVTVTGCLFMGDFL